MSNITDKISEAGYSKASERRTSGLIGHVIRYHPESLTCDCDEHGPGVTVRDSERHTVDVKVIMGKKEEELKRVPCFVYSQGILSDGLAKNDRVWVQFINGDKSLPVVTGFYREPSAMKIIMNSFKYSVANVFNLMGIGK